MISSHLNRHVALKSRLSLQIHRQPPRTLTTHASPPNHPSSSKLVQNETMLLVFQLDFDIQLQRCLNESLYEMAKDVRAARTKVDEALEELMKRKLSQQSKQDGDQVAPAGKVLAPSEYASEGLRLRMQQQKAVESENYKEAARIRDLIAALDLERKKAESALSASSTSFSVNPILRYYSSQRLQQIIIINLLLEKTSPSSPTSQHPQVGTACKTQARWLQGSCGRMGFEMLRVRRMAVPPTPVCSRSILPLARGCSRLAVDGEWGGGGLASDGLRPSVPPLCTGDRPNA